MKSSKKLAVVALCVLGIGYGMSHAQEADSKLEDFFRQYLEQQFRFHPLDATRLGDHRFDHLMDDLSSDARARALVHTRKTLEELPKQVKYAQLSRDGQIDFEILQHELLTSIWLEENTYPFEENPRLYNEYLSDSVFLLLTQSRLPKETNIANCLARMARLPEVTAAAKANLRNPPRPVLDTAIRQNRGAISFYEKDIFELIGDSPQLAALKSASERAATVLKEYQRFLEEDLRPLAKGEWRLG